MITYLIIRHRVKDYAQWKPVFDEHVDLRLEYGIRRGEICRDVDDPQELTIAMRCDDVERAREFIRSESLRKAMKRAGVIDEPTVYFMEQVAEVPELAAAHGG